MNVILPLIAQHFALRMRSERFLIHDRTHDLVLAGDHGDTTIVVAPVIDMPAVSATEHSYERLWKMYYDTITIDERMNLKLRVSNMPKRYWYNMTEFLAEPKTIADLSCEHYAQFTDLPSTAWDNRQL